MSFFFLSHFASFFVRVIFIAVMFITVLLTYSLSCVLLRFLYLKLQSELLL